jgi:hypothetical protein
MFNRFCFGALLLACLALTFTGCNNTPGLTTIVISPATVTVTLAPPGFQQGINQYKAIGYYGHADHQTTADITSQVTWSSSGTQVATINSSGLATATGYNPSTGEGWTGITNITASAPGFNGVIVSNNATFTVTSCTSCVNSDISTITVLPATQTIASLGVPIQFEAVGLTVSGTSEALTNLAGIHWVSSAPSVATINAATGLATTVGSGTTTITATFTNSDGSGAVGSATLTVAASGSPEPLTALIVAPNAQTALSIGQTAQFLAIATTGSGASVNLTNQSATVGLQTIQPATWVSSNPSVATINPATGVATSVAAGATVITAIAKNPDGSVVTGAATYTVTVTGSSSSEPLVSLAIVPASQTLTAAGQTAGLIAIGTTSSGTTVNLTNQTATVGTATIQAATWSSSVPSVVSINAATGVATAVANGTTAVTAIAKNPDGTVVTGVATLTVNIPSSPEPLVSLAIVPAAQTLTAANQTAGLIVIGTTTNGTTVNLTNMPATIGSATISAATWKSSVSTVASIDPASGVVTAHANGTTAITAMAANPDGTVVTGIATLTVSIPATPEPLVSLAIVPASQTLTAVNQTAGLIAIGTTSTGTTVNLTNTSTWSSSVPTVATITSPGVVKALANGTTAITAIFSNTDGSIVTGVATVTVSIPSTPEALLSLTIVPASQSVASAGQTTQFLAIGNFATNSSTPGNQNMANVSGYTLTWSSSNTQVATIGSSSGIATGVGQGTTAITAIVTNNADHSGATATATFTVTGPAAEPISALSIFPGSQSITLPLPGQPLQIAQYIAIGTNSSTGLQTDVTSQVAWSSTNPLVATVDTTGIATALSQGLTTITAIATNPDHSVVTATATLTVANVVSEPLISVSILPTSQSLASPGQTSQLIAIGTFSSAPITQNVTKGISSYPITTTWSSSNTSVATVCTAGSPAPCTASTDGLVTSVGQGTAAIIVVSSNPDGTLVTSTIPFTVVGGTTEMFTALTIYPGSQAATAPSQQNQFIVIGTAGSSSLQYDVTSMVQWCSSTPSVATIISAVSGSATCSNVSGTSPGIATAKAAGSTTLTATYTNPDNSKVLATASYSVTIGPSPEPLLTITIVPPAISVGQVLDTGQFLAYGTFSTTPTYQDITNGFYHAGFPNASCTAALAATGTSPCALIPVTWISTAPDVFPINTTGLPGDPAGVVTAYGEGTDVLIVEAANPDTTLVTQTATFSCPVGQCSPTPVAAQLATLTVYNAGENTTTWLITAPSNSDPTYSLIHCGPDSGNNPGGSVCEGNYPIGSTVTLTASPSNATFGGWSDNCETTANVPNTSPTCTVTLTNNETVGAIFN